MLLRTPRISKKKQAAILRHFVAGVSARTTGKLLGFNRKNIKAVNSRFRHYREVIYIHQSKAPRMSGDIEIDQAFFGGRGKKKDAALVRRLAGLTRKQILKHSKNLTPERLVEVVGFLQRGGAVYTHIVEHSDADTLVPLIRLVVSLPATIYTDKWQAFNALSADGYKHKAINHSLEYSDRRGKHINGIERFWSFAKGRLQPFFGIPRSTIALHIKECEWRYNHRDENLEKLLKQLLKEAL